MSSENVGPRYIPSVTGLLSRLSYVPRWVIVPMARPQTVSDHVYRCLVMARSFADTFGLEAEFELELFRYILIHEQDEALTGDIPSTAKGSRSEDGGALVNIARYIDTLEALSWFRKHHGPIGDRWIDINQSMINKLAKDGDRLAVHYDKHRLLRWGNDILEAME